MEENFAGTITYSNHKLYRKKSKILCGRMAMGNWSLFHILLLGVLLYSFTEVYFLKALLIDYIYIAIPVVIVLPYLIHGLFLVWCRIGSVEYEGSRLKLVTKCKVYTLPYTAKLETKVVQHNAYGSPLYYSIKLMFDDNGNKQVVRFFTDDLTCFNDVVAFFKR